MGFFGFNKFNKEKTWDDNAREAIVDIDDSYYGNEYIPQESTWDGEKTQGELGAPIEYDMSYSTLAARSWQLYAESEIAKILIETQVEWIIGSGLKLQAIPVRNIIGENDNWIDNFKQTIESRFRLHCKTFESTYSKNENVHMLARKAFKSSIVGGDCLVIIRVEKGIVNMQVVDGRHIMNPFDTEEHEKAKNRGNQIVHGVEINKRKEHVAFHIMEKDGKTKRVPARGSKTGRLQALMIYGDEYRVDEVRGMPIYSASMEKMKKIDRYVEAMVGGAEERAKIPYYFFKNHFSDDEPMLTAGIKQARNMGEPNEPSAVDYEEAARKVSMSTGKTVHDLPIGVDLKSLESTVELRLKEFTETNFIYICASVGLPYEVALMKYENSFSASRMASQSFMQIMMNKREIFNAKFYKPYYDVFMEIEILSSRVVADGYIKTLLNEDRLMKEAYHNAKFVGAGVPQADPSKEVKASILKIQNYLSTIDKETELLNGGDFDTNIEEYARETQKIEEKLDEKFVVAPNPENTNAEFNSEPKA